MPPCRSRLALTVALVHFGMLIASPRADAHGLGAQCKRSGDTIDLEAYFDDDTPAQDARVRVEDLKKKVVATGRTDAQGRWSFACPQPGRYLVVVDAGAGHRRTLWMSIPTGDGDIATAPGEGSIGSTQPPVTVSEGPDRDQFTSFPWLKLGIGLAVIGGIGLAFWISRHLAQAGHKRLAGKGGTGS